ncbi:MAG TPA: TlpA disulfide reductase family protein [Bryobacteraceae bacterium]|jgi:thiol-disulfide isomerase/thioredoxin|nr:TlpA disulfide reductase family protein [Bryobacteraceae bacterium]
MTRILAALALMAACVPFQAQAQGQSSPATQNPLNPFTQDSKASDDEAADFTHAVQEAGGGSPLDFTRAFEKFLEKHPQSSRREQIVRALFRASKDTKDQQRIAMYGEELLKKDPNDISVLEPVGTALNTMEDPKASAEALDLGRRLEHDLAQNEPTPNPAETPHEKGKRLFDHAKMVSAAFTIQADALGISGKFDQAVAMANKAVDALPTGDATRCVGRWEAKQGHYDAAVKAYAEAFAISDTPENHRDDRVRMTEFYRKNHPDEKGLGDIVLAAYDSMTVLNDKRMESFGNTPATKPIDFQLASLDGNRLPLLSLKGKVIVMDFWATWCNPCRAQHPLFEQVKKKFKDNGAVVFLEVNSGEPKDKVAQFVNQYGWSDGVYLDDGLSQALKVENLPTTVLLGRTGEVYSSMAGFSPSSFVDVLSSKITDALNATASAPPMRVQGN